MICMFVGYGFSQTLQAPFVHPGLNHSRADLDRMKEKVLAKEHPWIEGWDSLCNFRDSRADFKASPKPTLGGSDGTRQRAERDAKAAYYNMLRWYVTGDESHARCAVDILNDWSNSIKSVVTGELFMLPVAAFMKAADLVRLYPGWEQEDRERFEKMARDYFYPACRDFLGTPGSWPGWDGPANTCCLYIGVYLDDAEMVNSAIDYYKNGASGGSINQGIVFDGQPTEMGRDQPHAVIGLDFYADLCQTLWNQGVDMFSYQDNLLLKGFEYYAKFNLEHPVDWKPIVYQGHKFYYPAPSSNKPSSLPNNRILANEMVYHHYVDRKGVDAPWLRSMMKLKNVDVLTGMMYTCSDTTTAYRPYSVPAVPIGLKAVGGLRKIDLDWTLGKGGLASGYDIQRSSSVDGIFETIGGWSGNATSEYTDTAVVPGKTYYYRVRSKNQSGESGWTEPISVKAESGSVISYLTGWTQKDIGREDWMINGMTLYAPSNGNSFLLTGSGRDIYDPSHPEGNFTYTAVSGDFELVTRIYAGEQEGTQLKEKFGVAVRENISASSPKVMLWIGDNGTRCTHFMWRNTVSGDGDMAGSDHTWIPLWLKLVRKGNVFEASVSDNGTDWHSIGSQEIRFSVDCLAGIWVCGGAYRPLGYTVGFDHVSLTAAGTALPPMPENLKVETVGSTALKLSWSTQGHVSAYKLCRATSPDGPFVTLATNLSEPSYVDDVLEPATTYYYKVWSSNAAGESNGCAEGYASTSALSLPSAPSGVEAFAGNGFVGLSWKATGERTAYYQVRRGTSFGGPYTLMGRAMDCRFTDHKVDNGQMYYYVVSAVNAVGEGKASDEVKAYPQVGRCQYWPLDEGSGTEATDVWNGGVAQLVGNVGYEGGKFYSGVRLNGGHLSFPSGWASGWKDFSLSLWVRPERVDNWARIVDCNRGTDNNFFLTVQAAQTGFLRYAITQGGNSDEQQINTNFKMKAGAWTHIVLTQKGSTGILYANAVEVGRNENLTLSPSSLGATAQNFIGRSAYAADPSLFGWVDDVRVYDCALDAGQVSALYGAATQAIIFGELAECKVGDEAFTPPVSSTSGLSVALKSSAPSVVEVVDGHGLLPLSVGRSEITALQTGNLLYASALPVVRTQVVIEGSGVESMAQAGAEWCAEVSGGRLTVRFSSVPARNTVVGLYSLSGTLVGTVGVSGGLECGMPVGQMSSGVYLLKVSDGEHTGVRKIILNKETNGKM